MEADALEAFIDVRLAAMLRAPAMWGSVDAVEASCFLLVEVFERFCLRPDPTRSISPSEHTFIRFARSHPLTRRKPSPMTLSQWFTDPKWGCAEIATVPAEEMFHWPGVQVVTFFIAFKAHLKAL